MARMIPTVLSPNIKSSAERRIFEWFRDDPSTEGWFVLHSLGIANHMTLMFGEMDFLVVAPQYGIFALEVKGGRVSRTNGLWQFTNKYNEISSKVRGPFEQAKEAIFSVMAEIRKRCGSGSYLPNLLFNFGAMFPDIVFNVTDLEEEQWQVFDQRNGNKVGDYVRTLAQKTKNKWIQIHGSVYDDKIPDSKKAREFVNLLRGDFDKAVSMSSWVAQTEECLITLTETQMKCIDQLEDNPRCLIQGAAGTGKTLIAIEAAKRAVVNGEKVAFCCYNTQLANWIKMQFDKFDPKLRPEFVGTFHAFLFQIIRAADPTYKIPAIADNDPYFREEMPILCLDSINQYASLYDRLILDEAQDLICEEYLDIMEEILKNGISRGKWSMFGDFNHQALYFKGDLHEMRESLEKRTSFVNFKLKTNCRNTRRIGDEVKFLTGFENSDYLSSTIEGPPVYYEKYKSETEARDKLVLVIKRLMADGVACSNITILSPNKRENSIVSKVNEFNIHDLDLKNNRDIQFSTIQSFKGLENHVIILTDIDSFSREKLIYVGLSRAKSILYILETEKADQERNNMKLRWIK